MDLFQVYSRPFSVQYRARLLSQTTIFVLLVSIAFRFLVPLVIVWNSDVFWIKESQVHEMPDVQFKKRFILLVEGKNSTSQELIQYGYSTYPAINQAFANAQQYVPVQIENYELDPNIDQKLDKLYLKLTLPIDLAQSQIHSIHLLLFFDYRLNSRVDIRMESVAEIRSQNWVPAKAVHLDGSLQLFQKISFPHKGFDFRYNHSLISDSGAHLHVENEDLQEDSTLQENMRPLFDIEDFLKAYYKRNCK